MELKEFVREALLSITAGVKEANFKQKRFKIIGIKRNESGIDGNNVDFDVSIVIEQKSSNKVGDRSGSVSILNVVSGNLKDSTSTRQTDSYQNINRLRFQIWVAESEL